MATTVTTVAKEVFVFEANIEDVWALVSNVERSAECYPRVQQLVDLGNGAYRWEFKPTGFAGFSHQVIYACQYLVDESQHRVEWTPINPDDDTLISGGMALRAIDDGTEVTFNSTGDLRLPIPRMMKGMAANYIRSEFDKQLAEYINNMQNALK